ncbi:MAG: hypothetical protein AAB116_24005, partial [Candidatus Poribacteria bacterium]
ARVFCFYSSQNLIVIEIYGSLVSSVEMWSSTALACLLLLYLTQAKATLLRIFFATQESFPHLTRKNQIISGNYQISKSVIYTKG